MGKERRRESVIETTSALFIHFFLIFDLIKYLLIFFIDFN